MQPVNGRRIPNTPRLRREYSTPRLHQNAEIISYVCDSWNQVSRDYRSKSTFVTGGISGVPNVTYYQPTGSNNRLANFEPFDLESWWGKKLVQSVQNRTL
ncbi:hypothetical protein PGB90_006242 [Kerria lacca]